MAEGGPSPDDILKILITSDNHVGYGEKDEIRGGDSFLSFEEVLRIAADEKVDMILNGGDLFHDNKPSRRTLYKTIELLRKCRYCLNDREVNVEVLSDPAENFHNGFSGVNYEDPNYNVGLPFFIIHGNHDDPTGSGALPGESHLSALDLLSASNLINYFGKANDIKDIEIAPLLMRKGATKVALYGLGNIRDERLFQTWKKDKKVKWLRPEQSADEWFNMFVLHQNRIAHDAKKCIHEDMLPTFLDFIVWGHEHEAKPREEEGGGEGQTTIYQPGSTVATSLCEGEAKRKAVGILEIYKDTIRFQVRHLKTVRPFEIREVQLADQAGVDLRRPETIEAFLKQEVEDMIDTANRSYRPVPNAPDSLRLPLIRLKVAAPKDQTIFYTMSTQRFGQQFVGKVANPQDLLVLTKVKANTKRRVAADGDNEDGADAGVMHEDLTEDGQRQNGVSIMKTLARKLREAPSGQELKIFDEGELSAALANYVDKMENAAFEQFYHKAIKETQHQLLTKTGRAAGRDGKPEDDIMDRVSEIRKQRHDDAARQKRRAARSAALSQSPRTSPDATTTTSRRAGRGRAAADNDYEIDLDEDGDGFDALLPRERAGSRSPSPVPTSSSRRGQGNSQASAASSAPTSRARRGPSKNRTAGQRSIVDSLAKSAASASGSASASSTRQPSTRKRKQSEVARRAAASRAADSQISDDDGFEDDVDSGSDNEDWGAGRTRGVSVRGGASNAETVDDGDFEDDDDDDELLFEQPAARAGRKRAKTAAASNSSSRTTRRTQQSAASNRPRRRAQYDEDEDFGMEDEEDEWGTGGESAASMGASGPSPSAPGGGRFNRSRNKNRNQRAGR